MQTATNPKTGERVQFDEASNQWIPMETERRQAIADSQGIDALPVPNPLSAQDSQNIDAQAQQRIGIEDEVARRQAQPQQAPVVPRETPQEPQEGGIMQALDQAIPAPVAEFAAAVNRGALNLADFFTTDVLNAALQTAGSESRVPSIKDTIGGERIEGNFMEEGLPRRAVRTAGEFAAPVGGIGATTRALAQAAPKIGATTTQKVIQSLSAPAGSELAGGTLAGAGSEVGADVGGAVGELVGGEQGKATGETVGRLAGGVLAPVASVLAKDAGKMLVTKSAKKLLTEAAPTIEGLKQAARGVYRGIDDLGVTVSPSGTTRLVQSLRGLADKEGFNPAAQKGVASALRSLDDISGKPQSLTQIDNLRKNLANSDTTPSDARLGSMMTQRIDDFLDNLKPEMLSKGNASGKEVAAQYKDARQLWRRVKKSELIEEAFTKAGDQASGFENGIRTQFRSILGNKKKSRGFTKDEIAAMREVVRGTNLQNMAKLLGKFGLSEGQATNSLMGLGGVAAGAQFGGPVGAVAVPLIGQTSKTLARKLTRDGATGADLIVRAGKSGPDVTKAYLKLTKPSERSAQELTELLLRPDVSLEGLKQAMKNAPMKTKTLIDDAVFLTNAIKSQQGDTP